MLNKDLIVFSFVRIGLALSVNVKIDFLLLSSMSSQFGYDDKHDEQAFQLLLLTFCVNL